jgi:hypothetical protein
VTSGTAGASISIERRDQITAASVTGQWTVTTADFFNALVFAFRPGVVAVVPDPPTSLVATGETTTSVDLAWTAPASNGGSAITGYHVTPYIAGVAQTPVNTGSHGDDLHGHRPHDWSRLTRSP